MAALFYWGHFIFSVAAARCPSLWGLAAAGWTHKSFSFKTKTPPAPVLLKKAAKIKSGSGEPNLKKVGTVTWSQCKDIAQEKMEDLNAFDIEAGAEMIAGTARSMGLRVNRDK